jgi:hypothetical protein
MTEWHPPTAAELAELERLREDKRRRNAELDEDMRCLAAEGMLNIPEGADFAVLKPPWLSAVGDAEAIVVVRNPNIVRDGD